jgi:hypothetical protein
MTKIILNWRERLIIYLQNRKEKEIQTEKEMMFESIMHLLTEKLSLEESIEMFEDVSCSFRNSCIRQLADVEKDKSVLEKFLF